MHQSKLFSAALSLAGVAIGAAPGAAAAKEGQNGTRSNARPSAAPAQVVPEHQNLRLASFSPQADQPKLVRTKDGNLAPVLAVHTVQAGESLSAISQRYYKNSRSWPDIKAANSLTSDRLKPGMKINVPDLSIPTPQPPKVQTPEADAVVPRKIGREPEAAKTGRTAGTPALVRVVAADRNLAEKALDLLTPESRCRLAAKLSQVSGEPAAVVLSKLASNAGIALTPEGIRQFQKKQGLSVSGVPDRQTAEAICREISARWYKNLAETKIEDCRWLDGPREVNCVGLRGFDLKQGRHANTFNQWNDTIAFIWCDRYGRLFLDEYVATTDPGVREGRGIPDVNGDGRGDPGWLIGDRQYEYRPGSHKGKPGALVPVQPSLPVYRDTNHNGRIDANESAASRIPGTGDNVHWALGRGEQVGGFSHGCQVLHISHDDFLANVTPLFSGQDMVPYTLIDLKK